MPYSLILMTARTLYSQILTQRTLCHQMTSFLNLHNAMPLDGGATTVLSAVSGALTTTIRITEKVFEILAVGEQSRSLLATINQVNRQLDTARSLRRQKSGLLSTSEKDFIQQTFKSTEEALEHVARLVEKTRVDREIHGGKVGFYSRMHFVLKDSPNIVRAVTAISPRPLFTDQIRWSASHSSGLPTSNSTRQSSCWIIAKVHA
jgi:hypothetical protein